MANWNPTTYARFEAERRRPVEDLIARLPPNAYRRIVDLGCGAGQSTTALATRFPEAEVVGIDNSEAMLASARQRSPRLRFAFGDLATWSNGGADLVFSNAALHWAPNHIAVMARLAAELPAGGVLAAQFPDNLAEPSHVLMRLIAARPEFAGAAPGDAAGRETIGRFADYVTALSPHCAHIDVWRTTYSHRLADAQAIVDWVEGAGLRPYLEPLSAPQRQAYLALYLEGVAQAYPRQPWGGVLLEFPRLFVVAARQG